MAWHGTREQDSLLAHQAATFDAIISYRYLAPTFMAIDEARQRMVAETAQHRLLHAALPSDGRYRTVRGLRAHRAWLTRFGQWLSQARLWPALASIGKGH